MKKIKLILVGYGPRGKNWLQIIKKNKKTEIIAICDINEKTKDKYTIDIPFYSKISHALLESKADGIILSTPPFNRMKDLKACAKYRLPILVEKPLAVNFKEALSLVNFMNQQKLLLMVGLNFRYLPSTLEKIKLIKSKKVGKPHFSKFIYERWRDGKLKRLNKYPLYMKHPMLWEQSIHHFDLIRFIYNSNVKTPYVCQKVSILVILLHFSVKPDMKRFAYRPTCEKMISVALPQTTLLFTVSSFLTPVRACSVR